VSGTDETPAAESWTPAERALLDAALEFYGAADSVIDYGGEARPRLRYDVERLQGVRDAMAALEERVRAAHDEDVPAERIAAIARLEPEIVELIVQRYRTAAQGAAER
jgi:hypothetical protein